MTNKNNGLAVTNFESPPPIKNSFMPDITEDVKILQSLNVNLQVKAHNLENEVRRLKKEVQIYKGRSSIYESLTKDLATLRLQFDKTAVALLRKREAYDNLKKEMATLRAHASKQSTPIRPKHSTKLPSSGHLKCKLSLFDKGNRTDDSSDDEIIAYKLSRPGRPSIGSSCGNLSRQITAEEVIPSRLKEYAAAPAPLRNRVLIKLHSLKSASTESLESTGRKSIRAQEIPEKPSKKVAPTPKPKPNLDQSLPTMKSSSSIRAPPFIRPALANSNGQKFERLVKMNAASIKRSNSNCSTKSATSRPAFRLK